jgi:hypothetical protein
MATKAGVYSREACSGVTEVTAVGPDGLDLKKIIARTELITEQEQEDLWTLVDSAAVAPRSALRLVSEPPTATPARAPHRHTLRRKK